MATSLFWSHPQIHRIEFRLYSVDSTSTGGAGRMRLVAQPGGLTLGSAVHLVYKPLYGCIGYE